jgi:hypothetical protein
LSKFRSLRETLAMMSDPLLKLVWLGYVQQRLSHPSVRHRDINWDEVSSFLMCEGSNESVIPREVFERHRMGNIQVITGHVDDEAGHLFLDSLGAKAMRLSNEEKEMLSVVHGLARAGTQWSSPGEGGNNIQYRHAESAGATFLSSIQQLTSKKVAKEFHDVHGQAVIALDRNVKTLFETMTGRHPRVSRNRVSARTCNGGINHKSGFLRTKRFGRDGRFTELQVSHVDFEHDIQRNNAAISFTPLDEVGMFLQVWINNEPEQEEAGTIIYLPFGSVVMLPKYCIHAGGFAFTLDSKAKVNSYRMHLYVFAGVGDLSNKNIYTFPSGEVMSETKTPPVDYRLMEPLFS